jgi:hypothetical protein
MTERMEAELALLGTAYGDHEHHEDGSVVWVRIPSYAVPGDAFKQDAVEVAFQAPPDPGTAPYGFWVRPGLEPQSGGVISNYTYPEATPWGG